MKKFLIVFLLAPLLAFGQAKGEYKPYIVSGVLKLAGTEEVVVKLTHVMVVSDSPESAKLVFAILATKQYPKHILVDVLPSSLEDLIKANEKSVHGASEGDKL